MQVTSDADKDSVLPLHMPFKRTRGISENGSSLFQLKYARWYRNRLFLQPRFHFLPSMRVKQETVLHCFHHLTETAERNGETKMRHRLILGEVILSPQFGLFLLALGGEVAFPARTEVNVPVPELA